MDAQTYHYRDLDTIIEQVHALFETWESGDALPETMNVATLYQLKIAVHEWLANLVQHANFETETVEVALCVALDQDRLRCVIEDNSDGFVLDMHLEIEPEYIDSLPERGMGLLILKICTEDLLYQRDEFAGRNRLEFYVSADQDVWPDIPFS